MSEICRTTQPQFVGAGPDIPQLPPDVVPLPPSPHPVPSPSDLPPEVGEPTLPGQNEPVLEPNEAARGRWAADLTA